MSGSKALGTVFGLMLAAFYAAPAPGQVHAFHAEIQGIYWNPELNGWGFSFDVQKGILFGAVFGYDSAGEPTFYTLISERNDGNAGLTFSGDVFQTTANGTASEDVGDFDLQFGRNGGQPALAIDMSSPSLQLDDFVLVRFSYAETDRLGVLGGAQIRTWLGSLSDPADQTGATWFVTENRSTIDAQPTIDLIDDSGTAGFAALVQTETITTYVVFFPIDATQTLTFDFDLLNNRGGQGVRLVLDEQGNVVGDPGGFASAVVAVDAPASKAQFDPVPAVRRAEIIAAFTRYLEVSGR